jgi:hypothetical protein
MPQSREPPNQAIAADVALASLRTNAAERQYVVQTEFHVDVTPAPGPVPSATAGSPMGKI